MKISVIVPIFDCYDYIDRALTSIINQSYKNLEIIIIYKKCRELKSSYKKIKAFMNKDKRVKVYFQRSAGISNARNLGLAKATGEWLYFVDADDELDENAIKKLVQFCNISNFIIGGEEKIHKDFKQVFSTGKDCYCPKLSFADFIFLFNNYHLYSLHNKLYKKDLIKHGFLKNINYAEDYLFNLEYLFSVKNFVAVASVGYYYFYKHRPNSICVLEEKNKYDGFIKILPRINKIIERNFTPQQQIQIKLMTTKKVVLNLFRKMTHIDSNQARQAFLKQELSRKEIEFIIRNYIPQTAEERQILKILNSKDFKRIVNFNIATIDKIFNR